MDVIRYPYKSFWVFFGTAIPTSSFNSIQLFFILVYTVFIQIVAAATINFSLAGVQPLIEGGSYSRTAFISEGYLCADPVVSSCDRLVFQDYFSNSRDIMIKKPAAESSQGHLLSCFCLELTIIHGM